MSEETTPEEMESERAELWMDTLKYHIETMQIREAECRNNADKAIAQAETILQERLKLESALHKAGLRT